MILNIILSILFLMLSYPVASILFKYTKDEKKLYKKYFSSLIPAVLIASVILYFIDLKTSLTLAFMFLTLFFWNRK